MIKAYAVHEPQGELKPFEYDPGLLKDSEVEIDVEFCGICHSDLSMIDNEWALPSILLCRATRSSGPYRLQGPK